MKLGQLSDLCLRALLGRDALPPSLESSAERTSAAPDISTLPVTHVGVFLRLDGVEEKEARAGPGAGGGGGGDQLLACSQGCLLSGQQQPLLLRQAASCFTGSVVVKAEPSRVGADSSTWADVAAAAALDPSTTQLFGVPLLRGGPGGACFGALLVGSAAPAGDATAARRDFQLATLLANHLGRVHHGPLEALASLLRDTVLAPPGLGRAGSPSSSARVSSDGSERSASWTSRPAEEEPAGAGSADDLDCAEAGWSSDGEGGEEGGMSEGEGAGWPEDEEAEDALLAGLQAVDAGPCPGLPQLHTQPQAKMGRLLRFHHPGLELAFQGWHAASMRQTDMWGWALCVLLYAAELFLLPSYLLYWKLTTTQLAAYIASPLLTGLLLALGARRWTARLRSNGLMVSMALLAAWLLHAQNYLGLMEPQDYVRDKFLHGMGWLTVAPLLFQLPFHTEVAFHPLLAATQLPLLTAICARVYPSRPLAACLAVEIVKVCLRGVALPLAVLYLLELRARRVFLALPAAATAAEGGSRAGAGHDVVPAQEAVVPAAAAAAARPSTAAASAATGLRWRR